MLFTVCFLYFNNSIHGSLRNVIAGAKRLAQLILGSSHLAQMVIPALLQPIEKEERDCINTWKSDLHKTLRELAQCLYNALVSIPGLRIPSPPRGGMYIMVQLDIEYFDNTIQNDIDFTQQLFQEENVFVLPGSCFYPKRINRNTNGMNGNIPVVTKIDQQYYFRVVFCAPNSVLLEATERIRNFCYRHHSTERNE